MDRFELREKDCWEEGERGRKDGKGRQEEEEKEWEGGEGEWVND